MSPLTDEQLAAALREGGDGDGKPAGGCDQAARIWPAVRGELREEEVRALLDHSIGCADCAAAWRLARELSAGAGPASPAARLFSIRRWVAPIAGVALAASLLLFARAHQPQTDAAPAFRGAGDGAIQSLLPDVPQPRREGLLLRWSGPPGARYSLQVATASLDQLFRAHGLTEPQALVPAPALAGLPPGAQLVWRVEATLPDGRRVQSPAFRATLE